jgi:hypothetical protein
MDEKEFRDVDWSEKVEDPRELEWKYCFSSEERIAISEEILKSQKINSGK